MPIYRDAIARVTLPMLRAQLRPKRFALTHALTLERFGFRAEVKLARVPAPTTFGKGKRVFLACPRLGCGALVNSIACAMWIGWGCRKCLRWRSRRNSNWAFADPMKATTARKG